MSQKQSEMALLHNYFRHKQLNPKYFTTETGESTEIDKNKKNLKNKLRSMYQVDFTFSIPLCVLRDLCG